MIDHVLLGVSDFDRSRSFYDKALVPLGMQRISPDTAAIAGYGRDGAGALWIKAAAGAVSRVHVAFGVDSRASVDGFHTAALAAGGRDNGAPGLRPHYHPAYYGAFVHDPDGNNIEAVCHTPA